VGHLLHCDWFLSANLNKRITVVFKSIRLGGGGTRDTPVKLALVPNTSLQQQHSTINAVKLPRFPPNIQKHFQPTTFSVRQFLAINLPPCAPVTTRLLRTQKYHSNLPPTSEDVDEITSLLSDVEDSLATSRSLITYLQAQN
jgi:hypothetical protein